MTYFIIALLVVALVGAGVTSSKFRMWLKAGYAKIKALVKNANA